MQQLRKTTGGYSYNHVYEDMPISIYTNKELDNSVGKPLFKNNDEIKGIITLRDNTIITKRYKIIETISAFYSVFLVENSNKTREYMTEFESDIDTYQLINTHIKYVHLYLVETPDKKREWVNEETINHFKDINRPFIQKLKFWK